MPDNARLLLAAEKLDALTGFLAQAPGALTALLVPTAANGLPDREQIVAPCRARLAATGLTVIDFDLETADRDATAEAVAAADVVLVSGGNPFRLLAAARQCGFDRHVRDALADGARYVGVSAGATVAAPTLVPLVGVSPFPCPPGLDLDGMGLTNRLVLPHHDRPGRAARHHAALRHFGRDVQMTPIADAEAVLVSADDSATIHLRAGCTLRAARVADAPSVASAILDATRGPLSTSTLRRQHLEELTNEWYERIAAATHACAIGVVETGRRVVGVIWTRAAADLNLGPRVGELAAWFVRPSLRGEGLGRRLLDHGVAQLLIDGFHDVVVWIDEADEPTQQLCRRGGWRRDGARRPSSRPDGGISEARYRLRLP